MLAAAHETGLLAALAAAIPPPTPATPPRLAHARPATRWALLATLLFLPAVGLRRPWDLRAYTGAALAHLSGRTQAYGYQHPARFLAHLAQADSAAPFTTALITWTTHLWALTTPKASPVLYVDGHRKPVYSDALLPRGLVGRLGTVLPARTLALLHDAAGHPLLATTHRGDVHLTTSSLPLLHLAGAAAPALTQVPVVMDREALAAPFLAHLASAGQPVITLLRHNQYTDQHSFTAVGPFVPLTTDCTGRVVRAVAAAQFALRPADPAAPSLPLSVALIREGQGADGTRLVPIVSTGAGLDAAALAAVYRARWAAQENIIRDWLRPLGLDVNHGYARRPVANSESAKRWERLERRRTRAIGRAAAAGARAARAGARVPQLRARLVAGQERWARRRAREQRRGLQAGADARERAVADARLREQQAAERTARQARLRQVGQQQRGAAAAQAQYTAEATTLTAALRELAARERQMYELDDGQDQIMTVCKVALANLGMWVRDHYFPATYAQATWGRLAPFWRLGGRVVSEQEQVVVELARFHDAPLNRDLAAVCPRERAAAAAARWARPPAHGSPRSASRSKGTKVPSGLTSWLTVSKLSETVLSRLQATTGSTPPAPSGDNDGTDSLIDPHAAVGSGPERRPTHRRGDRCSIPPGSTRGPWDPAGDHNVGTLTRPAHPLPSWVARPRYPAPSVDPRPLRMNSISAVMTSVVGSSGARSEGHTPCQ